MDMPIRRRTCAGTPMRSSSCVLGGGHVPCRPSGPSHVLLPGSPADYARALDGRWTGCSRFVPAIGVRKRAQSRVGRLPSRTSRLPRPGAPGPPASSPYPVRCAGRWPWRPRRLPPWRAPQRTGAASRPRPGLSDPVVSPAGAKTQGVKLLSRRCSLWVVRAEAVRRQVSRRESLSGLYPSETRIGDTELSVREENIGIAGQCRPARQVLAEQKPVDDRGGRLAGEISALVVGSAKQNSKESSEGRRHPHQRHSIERRTVPASSGPRTP